MSRKHYNKSSFMPNKTGANNQHFDISWQIEPIQQFESDKTAIEHKQHLVDEKERIEAIPLNELSFKDFYKFPFYKQSIINWCYDADHRFAFEFADIGLSDTVIGKLLSIINCKSEPLQQRSYKFENGEIYVLHLDKWLHLITIRGWGNLTGCGAYNLKTEYAAKIQDTLGQYIVERLTLKSIEYTNNVSKD